MHVRSRAETPLTTSRWPDLLVFCAGLDSISRRFAFRRLLQVRFVFMSFNVKEHVISCQHLRLHGSTDRAGNDHPRLAVKQYTPLSNLISCPGDVTVIGTHAHGFVKVSFPYCGRTSSTESCRSFMKHSGRTSRRSCRNEIGKLEPYGLLIRVTKEPVDCWMKRQNTTMVIIQFPSTDYDSFTVVSWHDHSRDMLHMINHFRAEMIEPIVGIGHSMGANQM